MLRSCLRAEASVTTQTGSLRREGSAEVCYTGGTVHPNDTLISFSLALYSQWFYHKPTRCLFDAGEGVATTLGKKVFAIQHVFLSHGHEDHIAGIPNLVNIRNLTAGGEHDKPLAIYYPKHDRMIDAMIEYVEKKQRGMLRYPLYVQPVEPGDEIRIEGAKRTTRVVPFEMEHATGQLCLGYEIEQERRVLDVTTGQSVHRQYPIFFYSGDGFRAVNHSPFGRVELAVHEATFLERDAGEAADRIAHRHSTVERTIDWAAREDVKALVLCHLSDRYRIDEAIEAANAARTRFEFRGELYIAHRGEIVLARREDVIQ